MQDLEGQVRVSGSGMVGRALDRCVALAATQWGSQCRVCDYWGCLTPEGASGHCGEAF